MTRLATGMLMGGVLLLAGGATRAAPLTVGGNWAVFSWSQGPDVWDSEGAFTYDATCWTNLMVTDGGLSGDRFEVYDFGDPIGTTSVPTVNFDLLGNFDYDALFENPDSSSGQWLLAPGSHSITLYTVAIPGPEYPDGVGALRVECFDAPAVPAPAGALLASLGAALVGWLRRHRTL